MASKEDKELKKQLKAAEKEAAKAAKEKTTAEKKAAKQNKQKNKSSTAKSETPKSGKDSDKKKKLAVIESTQMWLPIRDIKDGIIITKDNRYVGILEFAPMNFALLTVEEQDAVASTFGSILRVLPANVQIKVLSRKANVENHVRKIQEHIAVEQNSNCRDLQNETIQLIEETAKNGIARRFFLSWEYVSPPGLHSPRWEDIVKEMYSTATHIISMLEEPPCENECISGFGNTDYVIGILYDCLCRSQAETIPLDVKCDSVNNSFLREGRAKYGQFIPVQEYIAPEVIDPSHYRYLRVDDKYYAFGYITADSYQDRYVAGWVSQFVNLGAGVDVDIWYNRESIEKVQQGIVYAQRLNNTRLKNTDQTNADYDDLSKQTGAGYYIRSGLSAGSEFMYFTIMLTITANSKEELNNKVRWVQNKIAAFGSKLRIVSFNQTEAYESSLPLLKPMKTVVKNGRRNALSSDLGSTYPFTAYEFNDIDGILLGINSENGSPVFINAFNKAVYENANMAILGRTGSGKTYLSQCITLRLRQQQTKTIIIAPLKGHEYKRSCDQMGGQFIDISAGSPHTINILEIRKIDTSTNDKINAMDSLKRSILKDKISSLKPFFTLILPDMTKAEERALESALFDCYKEKGITVNNKSLQDPANPSKYKEMPILGDLYNILSRNRTAKRVTDALYILVQGSADFFNGPTNVSLDNLYTVLNLSNLSDDLLSIGLYVATDFVYDTIQADVTERKAILFDEVWKLVGAGASSATAKFVLEIAKAVRSYNAMAIFTTQDLTDFFALDDGKWGTSILNCTKIQFVMGLTLNKEITKVGDELNLSAIERNQLRTFKRGDALLIANRNHVTIRAATSRREHDLINTDPEQLTRAFQAGN